MTGMLVGAVILVASCFGIWGVAFALIVAGGAALRFGFRMLLLVPLAIFSFWWVERASPPVAPSSVAEQSGWSLQITSMPLSRSRGYSFDARVLRGDAVGMQVWVLSFGEDPVGLGDKIYGSGSFTPREQLTAGFGTYVAGRGASGQLTLGWHTVDQPGTGPLAWLDRHRQMMLHRLQQTIPGDDGALLAGLVTGDDGRLTENADSAFRRAGLSHLTAVSGANLSAVTAMVLAVGGWTGRSRRFWLIGATASAWGYALMVGLSPPTLRAALVATGAAGGRLSGRPVDLLTITLLSGASQIAIRPTDARSISFQLSMIASLGIAAALSTYPNRTRHGMLYDAFMATFYAQIATLPLIAWTFHELPLFGLPANIAAAPLVAVAFPIGLLGALLLGIAPVAASALLVPAALCCRGLVLVARIYGGPTATVGLPAIGTVELAAGLMLSLAIVLVAGGEMTLLIRWFRRAET